MTNKFLLAGLAALALTACDKGDKAATNQAVTAAPVAAPNNGDWSEIYSKTAEGGFLMGNPNAKVRLIEYGSMTCPHCAEFEEQGMGPLVENYIKKGLVGFEFRNYVRDGADTAASILARCGGEASFFGLTRGMYATQAEWIGKLQSVNPQTISALPQNQQLGALAQATGLIDFAAQRGLPRDKANACLADPNAATQLVTLTNDANTQYQVPGTPAFVLNGKLVEMDNSATVWVQLDKALKDALG